MEKYLEPTALAIFWGMGMPFFLIYTRKSAWFSHRVYILAMALAFISAIIWAIIEPSKEKLILTWCTAFPILIYCLESFFRRLSERINQRDYILWLRFSDEINDSTWQGSPDVKPLDKIISIVLLFTIFGLLVLGVMLIK